MCVIFFGHETTTGNMQCIMGIQISYLKRSKVCKDAYFSLDYQDVVNVGPVK